jgi:glycosyltransferase involved in cell wall biosynthesis
MPVHNGGAYLREAVESILGQTFSDFELLVIDDASTDATPELLSSIDDPRMRVARSDERLQLAGALNRGLDLTRGRFIARMDADDISAPDRLAVQEAFLRTRPDVGLCGAMVETFGGRRGRFEGAPLKYDEALCYALYDNPFAHPTVMMRRETFEQHALRYDPSYCPSDDYELWSRALRLFPCVNLDRVVLKYRVHRGSLTQAEWSDMDRNAARVAERELRGLGLDPAEEDVRFHRNLGRGRGFPIRSREELDRAEAWLLSLLKHNGEARRFPVRTFERTTADVWRRACYHAGSLGGWMLRRYVSSPLMRCGKIGPRRMLALLRAAGGGRLS